jgi:hypothetical protein
VKNRPNELGIIQKAYPALEDLLPRLVAFFAESAKHVSNVYADLSTNGLTWTQ